LDLSDSDSLDVRPLRAATGLTRLALSGFALPPQHEVHMFSVAMFDVNQNRFFPTTWPDGHTADWLAAVERHLLVESCGRRRLSC
jgi:hypothetical protein